MRHLAKCTEDQIQNPIKLDDNIGTTIRSHVSTVHKAAASGHACTRMLTSAIALQRSRQRQQDVYTAMPDNHVWIRDTVTSEQSYKEYRDGKRARLSVRYPLVNRQPGEHNIIVHETDSHSKSLSHGATVLNEVAEGTTLGPQLSVYHHMQSHHALFWTPDIGPLTATSDDDMAKI